MPSPVIIMDVNSHQTVLIESIDGLIGDEHSNTVGRLNRINYLMIEH